MMEDSTEAHMETDVSSTTEDIPEPIKVASSPCNMEMVIVVEELKDETEFEEHTSEEVSTCDENMEVVEISDKNIVESNISPSKNLNQEVESTEVIQEPKSDQETLQVTPNKDTHSETSETSSAQVEAIDSSSKIEQTNPTIGILPITESITPEITSDIQNIPEQEISDKDDQTLSKSPVRENQVLPSSSPVKKMFTQSLTESLNKNENEAAPKSPVIENQSTTPSINGINIDPSENKVGITSKVLVNENPIQTSSTITVENNHVLTTLESTDKESDDTEKHDNLQSTDSIPEDQNQVNKIRLPIDITVERDVLNNSQMETTVEEKERNKSISRELKSLINSAKESKIISECTQITSKIRKSRTPLDTSLNTPEAEKIQGTRRQSSNSQKSNCSEKSEKATKRSMRSQNPEFVSKVKQFLNSVTNKVQRDSDEGTDDEIVEIKVNEKKAAEITPIKNTPIKRKKVEELVKLPDFPIKNGRLRSDSYCWRCHWEVEQVNEKSHAPLYCSVCPRTFHYKCLSGNERIKVNTDKNCVCPECLIILNAESSETRPPAMKKISLGRLCELLKYALERMMNLNGMEPFMSPVDRAAFPDYDKYVVHPMDLSMMKSNIEAGLYGSTEAFLADANWILHNSIIFNTLQSKLTGAARALVRSCRAEMCEIEACPECYAAAHARHLTWFTDVCSTPHILLWAKLKGFPYWPAKGMSVNSSGLVDVRFFGAHDRAWVPAKDCFLYSEKDPNNFRTKRQDILDSMQEAEQHIRNISRKYGKFVYPPFKTQLELNKLTEQLKMMIPSFDGEFKVVQKNKSSNASPISSKEKRRSNSKSSKSSNQEGDGSESEDLGSNTAKTKTTEPKEEKKIKMDIDSSISDKDKSIEVDAINSQAKTTSESRKRRHSTLEEGVLTILEPCVTEKRRRGVTDKKDKTPNQVSSSSKQEIVKEKLKTPKVEKSMEVDSNLEKPTKTSFKKQLEDSKSSPTEKTNKRITPIKIIFENKNNRLAIKNLKVGVPKISTPETKPIEKLSDSKEQKRRSSKSNKSLNNSITNKSENERKTEKKNNSVVNKDKIKDTETKNKDDNKAAKDKNSNKVTKSNDNNAVIVKRSRTNSKSTVNEDISRLPTISNVVSLSTLAQNTITTNRTTTSSNKTLEITIEANPNSSIFTPSSTDSATTSKDAQSNPKKLGNGTEPVVGSVGVRSFARMTSPKPQSEIKNEPIDLDDEDRHMEKMDLMKSFELRPVSVQTQALKEVRMNKMVITPLTTAKNSEVRPKAKKSFPQPRKPDESRSELNGKNSMVYIPIQPPTSQPPVRLNRPPANGPVVNTSKSTTNINTLHVNATSSQSTSLLAIPTLSLATTSTTTVAQSSSGVTIGQAPTIGQVPTAVHTVPLMTTVNGQWMWSLQPVMSVGGLDNSSSTPIVNGIVERANIPPGLIPLNSSPALGTSGTVVPAKVVPSTASTNKSNETTLAELPRLLQKPGVVNPLDANTALSTNIPTPPSAGPMTAKLHQNAAKLTEFFRNLLEDTLEKLDEPAATVATLHMQLERTKWRHQQEITELKHNHELTTAEMRAAFEKDMLRALNETKRLAQAELEVAVKQAKSKQWCANCNQEAQFYCCWNTSYCDYPCQRAHWSQHYAVCAQQSSQDSKSDGSTPSESRLQPRPGTLPKKATPAVGNGGAQIRAPERSVPAQNKMLASMLEDSSGKPAIKCVGTYKQPASTSMILNKQMINKEETSKKVVTSGGYLIVGGGAPHSATVVTPSRSTQPAIQYIHTS